MAYLIDGASTPNTVNSSVARTREYLSRYGHRDATMILIAYRHGLRASEVCDLQWHQVEINSGRLRMCLPQSVAGRLRRKASTR
jgi:integrase